MARPISEIPWLDKRNNGKFYVHWYDAGSHRTQRLSLRTTDLSEAKARFAAFLAEGGDIVRGAPAFRKSVTTVVDDYLREHALVNCADPVRQKNIAVHLKGFFGETAVADVNIPLSRKYAKWRDAAPATVRRELGMLVAAAHHAKKWGRLPADQLPTVELPAAPKHDLEFFTVDEVRALIESAEGRLRSFVILAYFTAARRKAIEQLEVSQVDLEHRRLYLHKSGERTTVKRKAIVPINDACVRELRFLLALTDTKYVFGTPTCYFRQFKRLCKRVGITGRNHPHLLRHSRATHLLQASQDVWKVAGLLGVRVTTVQNTYGHHTPEHAATAVAPFDQGLVTT